MINASRKEIADHDLAAAPEQLSEKYNIIQKPPQKCYEGLYPEWDENHPIHIIGHSQGGLTARMLEYLLEMNIENETSELLSNEYANHIKSITTFSTPHNGTSLAFIVNNKFPVLRKLSAYAGLLNNLLFIVEIDIKLVPCLGIINPFLWVLLFLEIFFKFFVGI